MPDACYKTCREAESDMPWGAAAAELDRAGKLIVEERFGGDADENGVNRLRSPRRALLAGVLERVALPPVDARLMQKLARLRLALALKPASDMRSVAGWLRSE
jgi:hypothetical protein